MHRSRTLLVVTFLLLLSLASVGPAAAGGPTSALLTVPGEGATASLYYTDPEYDALADLVGITGTGTGEVDRAGRGQARGPGITVTWLVHDVFPWRVDRIYPSGNGAAWIATQVADDGGTIWDSEVVWHRPGSGSELWALLDRLGVADAARQAGEFDGVAGARVDPPAGPLVDEPARAAAAAAGERSGAAGAWWSLAGLVAGVLATLVAMRLRGRGRPAGGAPGPTPGSHAPPAQDAETTGDTATGDAATGDAATGDGTTGDAATRDGITGDAATGDAATGAEPLGAEVALVEELSRPKAGR